MTLKIRAGSALDGSWGVCFLGLVFALAVLVSSCGGSGSSSSSTNTGTGGGGGGTGGTPDITVSPTSGEYVWEINEQHSLVYATVNTTTGAIGSPVSLGGYVPNSAGLPGMAVAPSGRFLYAFYANIGDLETFQLYGPGLQAVQRPFTQHLLLEQSLVLHPTGKFLYVIQSGSPTPQELFPVTIQEFSVDSTSGSLVPGTKIADNADLRLMAIDPSGRFLFANDLSGGRILAYQIDQASGSLTPIANSPFSLPPDQQPNYLAIGGSGNAIFLYANLIGGGTAALAIDNSTGNLTALPGSPFLADGRTMLNICVDPSGKYLYGTNMQDKSVHGLVIDQNTGELGAIPGSPFAMPVLAGVIAIDPSGKFLYAKNNDNLYGFGIDAATGQLSPLSGSPFPSALQTDSLLMSKVP